MKDVIKSVAVMDKNGMLNRLDRDEIGFSYRQSSIPQGSVILSANIILKKADKTYVEEKTRQYMDKKRQSQPLKEHSAGCAFKNPAGDSAGRLIELAGCKGMRVGDAEVSHIHANFIVNKGNATAKDFLKLMEIVRSRVKDASGVLLEPEIRIVGKND